MARVWDFLCEHGYAVMLVGMVLVAAGAIMLIQSRQSGIMLRQPAFVVAGIGIAVYLTGRVAVVLRDRHREKKKRREDKDDPTDLDSV
jgi:predicted tellurium resistance membrane protein TerC